MTSEKVPPKILLIEDNPGDARLLRIALMESDLYECKLDWITTLAEGITALENNFYMAVLLDLTLPDSRGIVTLTTLVSRFPALNIIVLTGYDDKVFGLQTVQAGAQDFLVKGKFDADSLSKSLRFSMERQRILSTLDIAQAEITKSREQYELIFQQSLDSIFLTAMDATIMNCNEAAAHALGYSREEMIGTSFKRFYYEIADREEAIKRLELSGRLKNQEIRFVRKSGEIIYCLVSASLFKTKDFTGYQTVLHDITEQKRHEELLKAKEVAERSAKLKEEFLANVSHEIRTPMNAILGMAHILLKTNLNKEQEHYTDSIRLASENLLKIINDILEVSQLNSGRLNIDKKPFQLNDIIHNVANLLNYKVIEKGLTLEYKLEEDVPPMVVGDSARLNQILLNLASNAVKFTDKGFVRITAVCEHANEQNCLIRFDVEDSGEGISPDKIDIVFDTFVQVSDDMRKSQGGTGLGLPIVKQLAELMGGMVSVKSNKGSGSVFSVTLPFQLSSNSIASLPSVISPVEMTPAPIRDKINILLAEDHKMNQIVAKKILESEWSNLHITIAENGREALDIFRERDFDLILMDIQMPEMDGYEATHAIRTQFVPPKSQVPILAMTAHAFISKDEKYKEFGMDDFVLKPFDPKQLFAKLAEWLNKEIPTSHNNASSFKPMQYINLDYLNLMADGDTDMQKIMIGMLLEEPLVELARMRTAAENESWPEVKQISHKLKSTFAFVGYAKLTDTNRDLERAATAPEQPKEIIPLSIAVEQLFLEALPELKAAYAKIN